MKLSDLLYEDMPIVGAAQLRALIGVLKDAVVRGELQQCWKESGSSEPDSKITDVDAQGPWPADGIEWHFFSEETSKIYRLTAETGHQADGLWEARGHIRHSG